MHKSAMLSRPFPKTLIPKDSTVFSTKLAFPMKLTELENFMSWKQECVVMDQKWFKEKISINIFPTCDCTSLKLTVTFAASKGLTGSFVDISNAFQTNVMLCPSKRFYVTVLSVYMEWYYFHWPNDPVSKMNYKDLLIQVLKQSQGTKDARKQWCSLLVRIFIKTLKMKACTINKGVFIWM
jgi:hypothetical protein